MPSISREEASHHGTAQGTRIVTLLLKSQHSIWLALEDLDWAMEYIFRQIYFKSERPGSSDKPETAVDGVGAGELSPASGNGDQ